MRNLRDGRKRRFGATFTTINLARHFNWPKGRISGPWWKKLAEDVGKYAKGLKEVWGIPFRMAGSGCRVILAAGGSGKITIPAAGRGDFLCILHEWRQLPGSIRDDQPEEGLVVAEYELAYDDGTRDILPVRSRFEVAMAESPGPPWQAVRFDKWDTLNPGDPPAGRPWGNAQTGLAGGWGVPLVCTIPVPSPDKGIRSIGIRGLSDSPLLVAGMTLYRGASHPLRHLPRRHYRIRLPGGPAKIRKARIDLGGVAQIERTSGIRGRKWLASPYAGLARPPEPEAKGEDLIEAFGAEDATLSVKLKGKPSPLRFSLGEAFHNGSTRDHAGKTRLEVLDRDRQWMKVIVRDASTGKPTPARIHLSGPAGQYIAPYGHHQQINARWFEDYGADVQVGGRNFAYVPGEFTTDMPVGDVYVEASKGFEYAPVRQKLTVLPGQKVLEIPVERAIDWRRSGWVTADTHVHFISPHTAALQARGEGVNVVNLLASQWGRLFTNVGDIRGRVNVVEDDTIVYVGTENRNHMLGHMSMLGTQGLPVYPMCCGGPTESYVGDPDFLALAEWARENRAKGGVVIRPHYPYCGHTEDPVPILAGLVDALEICGSGNETNFATQEWYRYLNCGYRVAVCGGTDKMGAYCALGWLRTYALTGRNEPLNYGRWASAVRAGRTFSTSGPLIDMTVEGRRIGDAIRLPAGGGTVEVEAGAESVWPLGRLEIVQNGRVVADRRTDGGAGKMRLKARLPVRGSGWIAARCSGFDRHPGAKLAAHTSPVYLEVRGDRAFDGPAAQHMLALVEGGIEYLQTLATVFDESSRKRMVKLFREARHELKGRLLVEGGQPAHHGQGPYHHHGYSRDAGHCHD